VSTANTAALIKLQFKIPPLAVLPRGLDSVQNLMTKGFQGILVPNWACKLMPFEKRVKHYGTALLEHMEWNSAVLSLIYGME
jgi:hypothetical protein